MATGPRQQMIGNLPAGGEQNSAKPGPDYSREIASAKRGAEGAGNRLHTASQLQVPAGGATGRERS